MNSIRITDGYIKIKDPDWGLVGSIILDCIGPSRNMQSFERLSGIGKGSVSKLLLRRRTEAMSLECMQKMLDVADENCHVNLDGFAAANGLLSVSAAERLLESLKPAYKDIPDYRRLEYKDAEFVRYPVPDTNDFERFAENLSMFIGGNHTGPKLMLRADEMFEDKMLVLSLEKWRCHFCSEKASKTTKKLADKYSKVIQKTLGDMGYLPAVAG